MTTALAADLCVSDEEPEMVVSVDRRPLLKWPAACLCVVSSVNRLSESMPLECGLAMRPSRLLSVRELGSSGPFAFVADERRR